MRKKSIYSVLILRLLIILVLFIISRIIFYLFNLSYFSEVTPIEFIKIFLYGIVFDISAICMINAPYIILNTIPFKFRLNHIYQKIINIFFYIINSAALAANFVDVIYFRFTLKRLTGDIFHYLNIGENDFVPLIPRFMRDFWYMFVIGFIFIFLIVFLCNKIKLNYKKIHLSNTKYYFSRTLLFLLFMFITIIGIRGGFQLKPISIINAGYYTRSKNVTIVLNTPFTIIKTINKKALKDVHYFTNKEELDKIYTPYHKAKKNTSNASFKKINVVVIILESFSKEHSGLLNKNFEHGHYKGFTPFLDSLIAQSLLFNGFANGKRSIEGIPAALASLPTLMDNSYVSSIYAGDKINSLASLLRKKGYSTAFYHGGHNGTMGFDSFAKMAGFEKYYGKNEYNNDKDYDGKWGIFDEPFEQYIAKSLNKTRQPFFASFFTLSSHHPYTIPEKHKGQFPKGKLKIQQSVAYADYALGRFFKTASKMPWFDNTLFVLTADHTSEAYFPYYQTRVGMYEIPILFYKHNSDLKGMSHEICQQIDIMPSILDYMNYGKDYIAFGTSVFDSTAAHFCINYLHETYQLIKGDYELQFDGNKSLFLYNYKNDSLLQNNLIKSKDSIKNEMETFLKAVIQQYNTHTIKNELTVK